MACYKDNNELLEMRISDDDIYEAMKEIPDILNFGCNKMERARQRIREEKNFFACNFTY